MYRVVVEDRFSAVHHIRFSDGTVEPSHGHDWRVRVTFARPALDELGMVIDFGEASKALREVTRQLNHRDLHDLSAFREKNPTAEVVAEWIFRRFVEMGIDSVEHVEVTEAPGCMARYGRS